MAITTDDRALTVQEAYDALDAFGQRAGQLPLLLLLHACVPQSFRADLLNLLKSNFLGTLAGTDLTIDADVLLSPLVQPVAAGYYRLDPHVRRHGLALLDAEYRHQHERRSVQVARLILAYADAVEGDAGQAIDALLSEYLAVQRWVALAFIDPERAAEAFARAIAQADSAAARSVRLRLGSVTAAVSIPLTGHRDLMAYARGLDAMASGDAEKGERLLDWVGEGPLRVGGVTLPPVRRQKRATSGSPATSAAEAETPAQAQPPAPNTIDGFVYISYAVDDQLAAQRLAGELRSAGLEVRIAGERLQPGADSQQKAYEAIDNCKAFVALISHHTLARAEGVFRSEWQRAFDRQEWMSAPKSYLIPVAVDDVSRVDPRLPAEFRVREWASIAGDSGPLVRSLLELMGKPAPARGQLFGVPGSPESIIGRSSPLADLERFLTLRPPLPPGGPSAAASLRARAVWLSGPEGIGKWTLASHAVRRVAGQFSDVIWISGDRQYLWDPLQEYADARRVKEDLLATNGGINRGEFEKAFARARVLFVVDERTTREVAPVLVTAGSGCVVLRIRNERPGNIGPDWAVALDSLDQETASRLLDASAGRAIAPSSPVFRFAEGSPLLLRLLGGCFRAGSDVDPGGHVERFTSRTSGADAKVAWLVEFLWNTPAREDLRALFHAMPEGTLVSSERLLDLRPAWLQELGLLNVHADLVRVPLSVANAVRALIKTQPRPSSEQAARPAGDLAAEKLARGELDDAQRLYEERLQRAQATNDVREVAAALGNLASVAEGRGDLGRALSLQRECLSIYEQLGDQSAVAMTCVDLGRVLVQMARYDEATAQLERALEWSESEETDTALSLRVNILADLTSANFELGRTDRALEFARRRVDLQPRISYPEERVRALTDLAELTARSGNAIQASAIFEQALSAAERDQRGQVRIRAAMARHAAAQGHVESALAGYKATFDEMKDVPALSSQFIQVATDYGQLMRAVSSWEAGNSLLQEASRVAQKEGSSAVADELTAMLKQPDTPATREAILQQVRSWIRVNPQAQR